MHFQKAMFYKRHYCSYIQSLLYYFMYIIIYIILYCSYVMFLYSVLNIHWKDWCWSWSSYTLATWWKELTHWKRPWCWERSEKPMAAHSSALAWKIPWTEESGRLQSMGSLRVRHDWATSLSLFTFTHWRRKWQPIPVFLPGESQGQGAWWAAVYGIAQSWTQLKWLSSSSSS